MLFSVDSFFLLRRQHDLFSFASKIRHIVAKVSLSIFFKKDIRKRNKKIELFLTETAAYRREGLIGGW
jgi:hypothetical protein